MFDVIMEDGSNRASHKFAGFNHLFADGLGDHGIYVVEDTHSNYSHSERVPLAVEGGGYGGWVIS